jgi:hypothetical protein
MATPIDNYTLRLSLLDENGNEVCKSDMLYGQIEVLRKTHGVGAGALLEQMLQDVMHQATAEQDPDKKLPPRKPGGTDFNK